MRGFTSSLWPIHYKPLPDELLSCWLVRLAHGHGLKAQTFCNLIFGNRHQVWNRDIDRLAPSWLIDELCYRTGATHEAAMSTTLRAYERFLYPKTKISGVMPWILSLKMYHRKRAGYGLQFCPACLAVDTIPYFRKAWRVAFNTVCIHHGTMMLDRCPECRSAVAVHRIDMGALGDIETTPLSFCHVCGFDLRAAPTSPPASYDAQGAAALMSAAQAIDHRETPVIDWNLGRYSVMHHLCNLMTARYQDLHLRQFVLDNIGVAEIPLTHGHISFEMRPIEERHHILQLAAWLFVDLESRLKTAWRAGAIRYNLLTKGLSEQPKWYGQIVSEFTHWRDRLS